jgi:predicted DNA-binding transcriptional regulator AlpA
MPAESALRIATSDREESVDGLAHRVDSPQDPPRKRDLVPEQIAVDAAAVMAGVSPSTWWRLHSAAKVPKPNRLGGRTLWRVDEKRWIEAGCPNRRTWEAREAARIGRK